MEDFEPYGTYWLARTPPMIQDSQIEERGVIRDAWLLLVAAAKTVEDV
jgi:hypothetical protein